MDRMSKFKDPDGITVAHLKELIKNWPEVDKDGNPTEVWLGTGEGLSSPCTSIWPLNVSEGVGDILLDHQKD